jgi:hypothetical protein
VIGVLDVSASAEQLFPVRKRDFQARRRRPPANSEQKHADYRDKDPTRTQGMSASGSGR